MFALPVVLLLLSLVKSQEVKEPLVRSENLGSYISWSGEVLPEDPHCLEVLSSIPQSVKKTKTWRKCQESSEAVLECADKGYKVRKWSSFYFSNLMSTYSVKSFSVIT